MADDSVVVFWVREMGVLSRSLSWVTWLGRGRGATKLIVVRPRPCDDFLQPIDLSAESDDVEVQATQDAVKTLARLAVPETADGWDEGHVVPDVELRFCSGSDSSETRHRLVRELKADLLVIDGARPPEPDEASDGPDRILFGLDRYPCDAVWLRPGDTEAPKQRLRILVPVAGGPNATAALQLAASVAHIGAGSVQALMVEPKIGREAEAVGRNLAERLVRRTIATHRDHITPAVSVSDDATQAIRAFLEQEDVDLLMVGASSSGAVRRFFFKRVDLRLREAASSKTAVGVFRRALPVSSRFGRVIERTIRSNVPQLDRQGRLDLFTTIQNASEWNFDFVALVGLSTTIAALGLILDSTAVVIGAMLVAPLMTPLVGCGLALVQGNARLVSQAARAVVLGFLFALTLGVLLGLFLPGVSITDEMRARGGPGGVDLAIALLSGVAGAYATARPNLSGAIPGVAIAAALVPPIATSGIALAAGDFRLSAGALLLFITNIVAIVLGAAASLRALGIRTEHGHGTRGSWPLRAGIGLAVATILLLTLLPRAGRALQPVSDDTRRAVAEGLQRCDATLRELRLERLDGTRRWVVVYEATEAPSPTALKRALEPLRRDDATIELEYHTLLAPD